MISVKMVLHSATGSDGGDSEPHQDRRPEEVDHVSRERGSGIRQEGDEQEKETE